MATGIDLKSFYDANTSSGGLQLTIEDGTTKKANWEITPDNRLIRKISDGKIDATDVTGTDDQVVKIKIVNNKNPAGDVATFKITVLPDPDKVKFVWVGTGAQKNFVFTGGQNSIPLGPNLQTPSLQTQLNDGTVINDSWSNVTGINNDNVVFKTPTDANMTIASSNNSYSITIPSAAFDTSGQNLEYVSCNSSRSQDPTKMMLNVTAASIGSAKTLNLASAHTNNGGVQNGGVTITISGTLVFNTSLVNSIKFDQFDVNQGISLKQYLTSNPTAMNIPGSEIRFQKGYTYNYWDIKPCKTSGEDDFCLFRLRKDGKIDASAVKQNVGDTSEYVKLEATAPSMQETGNAGDGIPVNLAPDSGVQLVWWVPGESRPTTQFDILPNKDKGNSMKSYLMTTTTVTSGTATSYVRSCVDANCSTEIVGDTISYDPSKNSNRNSVENYPDPKNTTNNGDCNPALAGNSTHFYYDKGGRNGLPV